jgi:N-ATPase, AtpR subunit
MTVTAQSLVHALFWLGVGGALGGVFFKLLRVTAGFYATGRSWPWGVALHVARWVMLVPALIPIARAGALPLLATSFGVFVARTVVIRASGRAGK